MKIVKQMLMHIGTLYEKSDTRRAYSDSFTLHLESQFCLQHLKRLDPKIVCFSLTQTKIHPPVISDS